MIKKTFLFLSIFFVVPTLAKDLSTNHLDFQTTEEILSKVHTEKPTKCASNAFLQALQKHADEIDESESESKVRLWAHATMTGDVDALKEVLSCPEIKNVDEYTTVTFSPIVFEFPMGRTLTINYSTQPKLLKQKLMLATKPSLPDGNPNPRLMDPDDSAKYINTEPAWYAIMVVQHDSLKDFVGPDKNNTLSMKWIDDNIDTIYPHGYHCTSRSAWANDNDTINQVVHEVVDIEKDTNDYYVAGDINLEWVMYAEITADIIITAVTAGGGEFLVGWAKSARAGRIAKNIKNLFKDEHVIEYVKVTNQIAQKEQKIEKIKESGQSFRALRKQYQEALSAGRTAEAEDLLRQMANISNEMKEFKDPAISVASTLATEEKTTQEITKISKEIEQLSKQAKELSDAHKTVQAYQEVAKDLNDFNKYRRDLRAYKIPQTGNVITKNLKKIVKTVKAVNSGADKMNKIGRAVRPGMSSRSARIVDWLADNGLKHGARLAKYENKLGKIYGAVTLVQILGDMYDRTSTTSKEFSNGIVFKPLCLLSADDLEGQDNVVNYGMWLMWLGNSTDPSDDDAAYLQAMDFASKFYYQLDEFQDKHTPECNVDIYVVRPIIRLDETNVDEPKGELFYLFMNDVPWSTAEQFGEAVTNIED